MNKITDKTKLIFLDTETTGADLKNDFLCQVAYKIDDKMTVKNFKPIIPISIKAMSVTHITNKMVENEKAFKNSDTYKELEDLLKDNILVAHNTKFDIAMLENDGLKVPNSICTLKLIRYLDKEQSIDEYKLQFLRYYYGIELTVDPHSADGDVLVLEAVFNILYQEAKNKSSDSSREEIIQRMLKISSEPSLIRKIGFGKHKDSFLKDVALKDRGYLEWLLREKKKVEDGSEEDWIYSLEYFLGK